MIKIMGFVPKKDGWSDKDWLAHYFERHGPLVASVESFRRYTPKYVQNFTLMRDAPNRPAKLGSRYHAISELWFEDLQALSDAYNAPDFLPTIRPDELLFITLEGPLVVIGREHVIVPGEMQNSDQRWARLSRHRVFVLHAQGQGTHEELHAKWKAASMAITADATFRKYVRRYVQTHAMMGAGGLQGLPGSSPYAVVDEFWIDGPEQALAFLQESATSAVFRQLEANTDLDATLIVIARSHIVFGQ